MGWVAPRESANSHGSRGTPSNLEAIDHPDCSGASRLRAWLRWLRRWLRLDRLAEGVGPPTVSSNEGFCGAPTGALAGFG